METNTESSTNGNTISDTEIKSNSGTGINDNTEINSEDKNLTCFFEDAKIIFKKMKDRRQELIQSEKKRNSIGFPNTPKNKDRTPDIIRKKNSEQVQNYLFAAYKPLVQA